MILLFTIILQICSKLVVVGLFSVNRQQLTELFCINKATVNSQCKGNCYLTKKLKETEQETQQGASVPAKYKSVNGELWFWEKFVFFLTQVSPEVTFHIHLVLNHSDGSCQQVFQPPRG